MRNLSDCNARFKIGLGNRSSVAFSADARFGLQRLDEVLARILVRLRARRGAGVIGAAVSECDGPDTESWQGLEDQWECEQVESRADMHRALDDGTGGCASRLMLPFPARVEAISDTAFAFLPPNESHFGFNAVALPVLDWSGSVIDYIAWREGAPWRWWREQEEVDLIGEDFAGLAELRGASVRLIETPAAWREAIERGARDVVCIVNWEADPRRLLHGWRVRCSAAVNKRLRESLSRYSRPTFRIEIDGGRRGATK